VLKKDLAHIMDDTNKVEHPEYPVDMIDRLWDDYHKERENLGNALID